MAATAGASSSPTSRPSEALHLHRRARTAARVDPQFVVKELAPHAEEWEETTFPDSVFARMGELGFLGLDKPESTAARAATTTRRSCWPRRSCMRSPAAWRWAWRCTPTWRCRRSSRSGPGAEAGMGRAGDQGREDPLPGITEPDAGSDVAGIKTRAVNDGDEYVINGSKTYITNGHRADVIVLVTKTDFGRRLRRLHPVPRADDAPGVIARRAGEARHARLRHGAARVQDVRVPRAPCSARSARASTTSCGSSRASA